MKYGDLIAFEDVDEVKELRKSGAADQARTDVRTYVISNAMAARLKDVVFPALDFAQSGERKCLLIVATYGTGKTHLMSVISALAENAELLADLTNKDVAAAAAPVAGKFMVIREEIGTTLMPLRDIVCGMLEGGLERMGVTFKFPPADKVSNTKDSLADMMAAFEAKYPDKGLLLALDELLDYLRQRRDTDFIYDLAILRELGEFARGSRFRFVAGVQEALFDNPRFESAADAVRRVRDRYQQVPIVREDVAFVVKERLLRKTVEQRDLIAAHLRKFSQGFEGMAEQFDEYVSLFPIHPAYLETFEKLTIVEKRRILASLSSAMRKVMAQDVPTDAPGIVCYDAYRQELADDSANRTIEEIRIVLEKSGTLRNRVGKALTPTEDRPMALRIVDALAVQRLATDSDIRARIGPTPAELRDDLLLMPPGMELDPLLLEEAVQTVIDEIGKAVSWQFIHQDPDSGQVFIAVDKDVDYDKKIEERASSLDERELDRAYFGALEQVLEQRDRPYQSSINIWEYQLRWAAKRVTRRGYLFFGAPNERSTAKPPRDFYLYFLQPFDTPAFTDEEKPDEVFFRLKADDSFRAALKRYAGAVALERESATAEHQRVYREKYTQALAEMVRWLRENMDTAITVTYRGDSMLLGERFAQLAMQRGSIKTIIDAISASALAPHFDARYPGYPTFQVEITYGADGNVGEMVRQAIAGIVNNRPSQTATRVLQSLELLDVKGTPLPGGTYAKFLRDKLIQADPMAVNRDEIVHEIDRGVTVWGPWNLEPAWLAVVAASLCQQGRLEIGFPGAQIDATGLSVLNTKNLDELEQVTHISPPKATPIVLLKAVAGFLGLQESSVPAGGANEQLVKLIVDSATGMRNRVANAKALVQDGIQVWGQDVVPQKEERLARLDRVSAVAEDLVRRTTIGLLNKISLTTTQIAAAKDALDELRWVEQTKRGADALAPDVNYLRSARDIMGEADPMREETEDLRKRIVDAFLDGEIEQHEVDDLRRDTAAARRAYVDEAARAHARDRLDAAGYSRKQALLSGDLFKSLETLANVTLLPEDRLRSIKERLAGLIACREFDESRDLVQSIECPLCKYRPKRSDGPTAAARLDAVADDARTVLDEWERTLVDAIRDPETREKFGALDSVKRATLERLVADGHLPDHVDNAFVAAVNAALERFERRNATPADVWRALFPSSSPATVADLRGRFNRFLDELEASAGGRPVRVVPADAPSGEAQE